MAAADSARFGCVSDVWRNLRLGERDDFFRNTPFALDACIVESSSKLICQAFPGGMLALSEDFYAFSRVFSLVLVNSDLPNSHPKKDGGPSAKSLRLYQDRPVLKLPSPLPSPVPAFNDPC